MPIKANLKSYYSSEVEIEKDIFICSLHGKLCIKVTLMHSSACCTTTITTNWHANINFDNVFFLHIYENIRFFKLLYN